MKTVKRNTVSKEKTRPKKVAKSKREISKLKAGASLEKAVKNVQQIFEKKKADAKTEAKAKKKPSLTKHKRKLRPKNLQHKGIVYVGHIPHGFYEEQLKDYFQQFGKVTQVRVSRSKKNGKSRGYGYVEFVHTDVAKIAAETMNNYLMCGRLLKATYIPPEREHHRFFLGKNWSEENYPKLQERQKMIRTKNAVQSAEDYERYVQKSRNKLSALEKKLEDKGISMKFQPIGVPET
ncbi:hypothetical protein DMN91_004482 [Ooceraea biroi]|uniref:MKI67 FHA domain-interacting nucleolar phosphoprotein n=1 Tax=Ooceraea biroi TaxID=2015173 RepID=A0A026X0G7_OOCBI|nr:MKI67 FHA domain-interacting nucleolar phosphoprotein [Ooceraea biroi]EZA61762.1 MKI67 FHA domain-interacting nucleolar phosphoprotein [Ooceraea biroi]RLU24270.1 hypothetical protein DMN91_004482 [Ooceraea biroi]